MLKPISELSICGIDAKYEDAYLSIESEIDNMNSPGRDTEINWQFISDECASLLSSQTKDIKLMCWWAYAQYQLSELAGLRESIDIINSMLEHFNHHIHPKSNKAKWGSFSWFDSVITAKLIQDNRISVPLNESEVFFDSLNKLRTQACALCDTNENIFSDISRLLKTNIAEHNRQNEAVNVKPSSSDSKSHYSNVNGDIENDAEAAKILNQMKKSAEQLINYWRGQRINDLRALRLTRMISWLEIEGLPLSQNGKTMLNPPSSERIEQINDLIAQGKNEEALQLLENVLLRAPFWLAGHYKVFQIYQAMEDSQAADEIKNMLYAFIQSNKGLSELTFRDGTPFVATEIKTWINDDTSELKGGEINDVPANTLQITGEQCYELVNKKNSKEAMEILQRAFRDAGSHEEKFQWRFLHAQVALAAGKPPMTQALLEELERDIEYYRLEEWQPELVAKVYRFYLSSFNRSQIEREKFDTAFHRLCRVDTASAIEIK